MRILALVLIIAIGLGAGANGLGLAAGAQDGELALVTSGTSFTWTNVSPVGSCARCGRNVYGVETDKNFRVSIWHENRKRFDGCLFCLLAAVDSASR